VKRSYDRRLSRIWDSLKGARLSKPFSPAMVEVLPDAAERYLLHAISVGSPLASSVQLKMHGSMRLKPNAGWLDMEAEQILAPPRGFVWRASVGRWPIRFSGADFYFDGDANVRFWLWGMIPLVNAGGVDTARSAAGRLAGESVFLPSALLPERGARWEPVDRSSARVTLDIGGESSSITVVVGDSGALRRVVMQRWGDRADDGRFDYIPFGVEVHDELTSGGYTIPSRISAGWWFGTDRYFEFFRATIELAEFR